MSILVWRWGEILAHLYLDGAPTLELTAADVCAELCVAGTGHSRDISFRFRVIGQKSTAPLQREAVTATVIAVHWPLVLALSRRTGLSQTALWRLVTDGMTNGFLVWGKRTGRLDFAMSEAEAVFAQEPLRNRQWQFVEAVGASGAREWFRLRGGCCRLYKSEEPIAGRLPEANCRLELLYCRDPLTENPSTEASRLTRSRTVAPTHCHWHGLFASRLSVGSFLIDLPRQDGRTRA